MKSRRAATCSLAWLAVWFLFAFALAAQPKAIRLRNEMILTPEPQPQAAAAPAAEDRAPVSGLFLIQFTGPFQPAWQEELRAAGKGSVNGIVIFNFPSLCLKGSHANGT